MTYNKTLRLKTMTFQSNLGTSLLPRTRVPMINSKGVAFCASGNTAGESALTSAAVSRAPAKRTAAVTVWIEAVLCCAVPCY